MDQTTLSARARQLGSVLEPLTGQVYFSPECHQNYVRLGFDASRRFSKRWAVIGSRG